MISVGLCTSGLTGGYGSPPHPGRRVGTDRSAGVGESIPVDEAERQTIGGTTAMFDESNSRVRRLLRAVMVRPPGRLLAPPTVPSSLNTAGGPV